MTLLIAFLLICLLSAVAVAAYQLGDARRWKRSAADLQHTNEQLRSQAEEAQRTVIRQEGEIGKARELADMQLKLLTKTQTEFEEKFRTLAADALQNNSQLFLDRSREQVSHLIEPVSQSLQRFETQVQSLERARVGAYESLTSQ